RLGVEDDRTPDDRAAEHHRADHGQPGRRWRRHREPVPDGEQPRADRLEHLVDRRHRRNPHRGRRGAVVRGVAVEASPGVHRVTATAKIKMAGLLAVLGVLALGIVSIIGNPYNPRPIATGAAGVRQPNPTTTDGTYMYVTVSWEQGKTAAVSLTAGGHPVLPPLWIDD